MSKSFLPIMVVATLVWVALSFRWPNAWVAASWCAGCAWTAWVHKDQPLATSRSQHEGAGR